MSAPQELNQHFFGAWSPAMAYVLGYFAADGSMIAHKNGGKYIEFTSTDRVLLENLQKVANSSCKISSRPLRNNKCKPSWRIQIGSREWFEDLSKLGFTPNKSNTLNFPNVPDEYFGDFVRGYFDGDGCVYLKEHWAKDRNGYRIVFMLRFTSGSIAFLKTLHQLLRSHGEVKGGYIYAKQKSGHELVFSWKDGLAISRLMYNTSHATGLFLPRKRHKLESAIQALGLDK